MRVELQRRFGPKRQTRQRLADRLHVSRGDSAEVILESHRCVELTAALE